MWGLLGKICQTEFEVDRFHSLFYLIRTRNSHRQADMASLKDVGI